MCFSFKKKTKAVNQDRRKSNFEYLEFLEVHAEIGIQSRKEGGYTFLEKSYAPRRLMGNVELGPYMDRPYNVIEDEYYAHELQIFRPGTWKRYEASAFQTIRINIARATCSKVHLMLHRKSGYLGIMKVIPGQKGSQARGELNILSVTRESPFLVRLIDGFLSSPSPPTEATPENTNYYLFMEYAPFRTLDHLTQAVKGVGSNNAKLYALEIACALDFLHQRNIIHRDITPENVLVLLSGHVALGDLGAAIHMDGPTITNRVCGSYVTRPPEVWNNENYSFPVDIWEFGATLYYIISNMWPFVHAVREKHIQQILSGKMLFNSSFSEVAIDLLTKIIQIQPSSRPTPQAIIKHKYFEDIKSPYTPPFTPHELQEMYHFGDEEALVRELVAQLK
ncbi:unnamed protein product [Candidula unifasciata]|uniref:Protein kinase domain-containing protein n=1 Tax=Candidula unifasciata TaxID=100452 RepID=A0A8S3YWJ5_9EUPU|nr:unnamed protein product [Candidula unifasciata]